MRIVVFAQERNVSSHYRAIEPMAALAERGHSVLLDGDPSLTETPEARSCEVAVISRYQGRTAHRLAESLRAAGLAIVWDHDDAVALAPQLNPRALEVQQRRSGLAAMLRASDVVTTTNPNLAEHFRELGAQCVHVIENHLGDHFADLRRADHDGCVLGWAAWTDHQVDWQELGMREMVERALDAHPELRVESIGPINLGLPADRYRQIGVVPLPDLGRHLTRFDIGIAPIADRPFNRARSNIKLKEYAAAGAVWLASPIGPYVGHGERQGGQLVPDDGWAEAIGELVAKPRLLRKLARRGRRWAASQLISRNTGPWEAALSEALERARMRRRAA